MIPYNKNAFGLNLIFRVHGSAVYRSIVPSLVSVGFYFCIRRLYDSASDDFGQEVGHPYAIGVLVGSTTFLLVFRASQGYNRYWEGATSVHHMASKWMDAAVHICAYHMQCDHYNSIKPPSFYDYPELNELYLTRDRERGIEVPFDDSEREESLLRYRKKRSTPHRSLSSMEKDDTRMMSKRELKTRSITKSINYLSGSRGKLSLSGSGTLDEDLYDEDLFDKTEAVYSSRGKPFPLYGKPKLDGGWGGLFSEGNIFFDEKNPEVNDPKGFASIRGGRTPPLFLQELAHLSSLMAAVALSTLRNDIDGAESPLAFYRPGDPWPEVDPDKDEYLRMGSFAGIYHILRNFFGLGRSQQEQTRHNARRPLPVIGGVSDSEIRFLRMARGPYAKTQLCWNWFSEFCIREHLAGSLGEVGAPIISRVMQFLGDGMIYYNHARKIMFIPFPFVHAQLSVLFILVMIPSIPFLMNQYTSEPWIGSLLTFGTVLCLSGIHEVARELENPFRNIPNDLPLVTLQAQYNEALLTMYSGYHPDLFWDGDRMLRVRGKRLFSADKQQTPGKSKKNEVETIDPDEIASLKQQLAEQAQLIKELAAKVQSQKEASDNKSKNRTAPEFVNSEEMIEFETYDSDSEYAETPRKERKQ